MSEYEENPIAKIVARFINSTNRNIFLTGKAGTGKTTFLRSICHQTHKNVIVAAPTGIAAINAGGVTLHSLFQLPFGTILPENVAFNEGLSIQINTPQSLVKSFQMHKTKRNMLRELELLIIDEVSMLRADILDAIDVILRHVRQKKNIPFGGVQILFIGDLLQLPPVVKDEEWNYLSPYYKGMYFFNARILQQNQPLYVELEKIYRQTDSTFINLLNNLRDSKIESADVELLNKYYKPDFEQKNNDGYILLTTHNRIADEKNLKALGDIDSPSFYFKATVEGDFSEHMYPIEQKMELKKGAQVMFIKNDYSGEQKYYNGKIGTVKEVDNAEVIVEFSDGSDSASVEPYVWENKKYTLNKETNEIIEKVVGTYSHLPLKLAWAITVHKSQGLTFEKAIIDVGKAFAPGQIYVALSRLTSLDGLVLTSQVPEQGLSPDETLLEFTETKSSKEKLENDFDLASKQYFSHYLQEAFDFNTLLRELSYHISTYTKDEKRSLKQQYKKWASNLLDETRPLKKVADSFMVQIRNICLTDDDNYLKLLDERLNAAIGYFEPLIQGLSNKVFDKLSDLKGQKGIKKYLKELQDVDGLYTRQLQMMYKANSLIQASTNNVEFSKEEVKEPELVQKRKKVAKAVAEKPKKKSTKKTTKVDSKKLSYDLFKEGKTIKQIALERTLVAGTIEGHLSHYVRSGEINVVDIIGEEKLKQVSELVKELDTTNLGQLKVNVGDALSFGELRLAVSGILAEKEKQTNN